MRTSIRLAHDSRRRDRRHGERGKVALQICGTADERAPMAENSDVLQARYEALGGPFRLIAKEGVGHHPHSLDPPTPIVEFIRENRIRE